jgi:serine/threonine-protein kinase
LAGLENGPSVALSPDGIHLAYVARQGVAQQLYLRAMDRLEARPIPGTEGAIEPFFSPDGQWLGFFASGKLKKVSVNGGAALALGDAPSPRGASWSSLGTIAFSSTALSALQQVSDAGGASQPLTRFDKGDNTNRWPEFLSGGKALLFTAGTAVPALLTNPQVAVQSVGTGERRNLIPGATQARYTSSGHLFIHKGQT